MNIERDSTQEVVKLTKIKRNQSALETSFQIHNSMEAIDRPTNPRNVSKREFPTTSVYNKQKVREYMWKTCLAMSYFSVQYVLRRRMYFLLKCNIEHNHICAWDNCTVL